MSSAVLATIRVPKAGQAPMVYTVQVQGASETTGKYLVGFYLPGDVDRCRHRHHDRPPERSSRSSAPRRPRRTTRSTPMSIATARSR